MKMQFCSVSSVHKWTIVLVLLVFQFVSVRQATNSDDVKKTCTVQIDQTPANILSTEFPKPNNKSDMRILYVEICAFLEQNNLRFDANNLKELGIHNRVPICRSCDHTPASTCNVIPSDKSDSEKKHGGEQPFLTVPHYKRLSEECINELLALHSDIVKQYSIILLMKTDKKSIFIILIGAVLTICVLASYYSKSIVPPILAVVSLLLLLIICCTKALDSILVQDTKFEIIHMP